MNGRHTYRLAASVLPEFLDGLLAKAGIGVRDVDTWVVHQASGKALSHLQQHLDLPPDRFTRTLETHGNQIAASLPVTLHHAPRGPARAGAGDGADRHEARGSPSAARCCGAERCACASPAPAASSARMSRDSWRPADTVIATSRRPGTVPAEADGVTEHVADLATDDLRALVFDCEAVVHCAARASPWGSRDVFVRDNVDATRRLAQARASRACGGSCASRRPASTSDSTTARGSSKSSRRPPRGRRTTRKPSGWPSARCSRSRASVR